MLSEISIYEDKTTNLNVFSVFDIKIITLLFFFMLLCTTNLHNYMKSLLNNSHNLTDNPHMRINIYPYFKYFRVLNI